MRDIDLSQSTDGQIDAAVQHADPLVLRGLLFALTGDPALARIAVAPGPTRLPVLADPADAARLQAMAAEFLKAHRDAGAPEPSIDPERLPESLALTAGEEIAAADYEMWYEQTALDPWARTFDWAEVGGRPPQEAIDGFTVAIIGTGLGGLAAAVSLQRAGIPYFVIEKNPDVGGTWLENRYPGARVDSASRVYSHIFGADYPFPYAYCPRDENLKYIQWIADRFALREKVTFDTEVEEITYDEDSRQWTLRGTGPGGAQTWRADAVISAVGFLNRPNVPDIAGADSFAGPSFHTARWPKDFDHAGKRIGVIGSGASGYQLVPEAAREAAHVHLFQRTPSWCFESPVYLDPHPEQILWLERNVPFYRNFVRFRMSWNSAPHYLAKQMHVDPDFQDPHARSPQNKQMRDDRVAYISARLADRPELIPQMIPASPPMATRHILVDQAYNIYHALLRDNVSLVTEPIRRITPRGIETEDAAGDRQEIALDAIVYATGYRANDFLFPMTVRGREGRTVEQLWAKDGARAYVGTMMPGFPNFFMIYGPNTNNWGGLQIIDFEEMSVRFAVASIAGLIARGSRSVEPSEDAYARFNAELDRCEAKMLYADPRVNTYYRNEFGRSAVNNPIDIRRIWRWLREPANTDAEAHQDDAIVRARFGEDLLVG